MTVPKKEHEYTPEELVESLSNYDPEAVGESSPSDQPGSPPADTSTDKAGAPPEQTPEQARRDDKASNFQNTPEPAGWPTRPGPYPER